MTEPFAPAPGETDPRPPLGEVHSQAPPAKGAWERIKEHKVLQWSLAYLGAALALAHGQELLSHTYHWSELVGRLLMGVLIVGFPIALAVAWYHGHKGLKQISTGELTVISILIVIGAGLLTVLVRTPTEASNPTGATAAPAVTAASGTASTASVISGKSIAVLPFIDMSEKKDQEYFADGMAEEITDLLARIPGITVMSRTSSFQFKGRNEDLRTLGASLGVAYVLEGSVRKSGDRVRVTAQLIDARDGSHRWSGSYDRDLVDVLKVQDEISWGLVRALEVSMGADEPGTRPSLKSIEAYALYLRGRQAFNRYDEEGYDEAASYFQQATELDPDSALATAWLAFVNYNLAVYGLVQPDTGFADARRYAERARMLDPKSELATAALGVIYVQHDWNWAAGASELERALKLAPGSARILALHSLAPLALGHWDAALRDLNTSVALDPLYPAAHLLLGMTQLAAGHWSEAEVAFKRALDIAPSYAGTHFYLAEALLFKGEKQAALTQIDLESIETLRWAGRAAIFHSLGRKADSDAALKRLTELTSETNSAYDIAGVHAYRGEREEAISWLERALANKRDPVIYLIKSSILLKSLKEDARYKAILRKMKLPE
jgi:TolB-like protein/Tfp pilus assembly protein PilF